jgi:hypothetical protein
LFLVIYPVSPVTLSQAVSQIRAVIWPFGNKLLPGTLVASPGACLSGNRPSSARRAPRHNLVRSPRLLTTVFGTLLASLGGGISGNHPSHFCHALVATWRARPVHSGPLPPSTFHFRTLPFAKAYCTVTTKSSQQEKV